MERGRRPVLIVSQTRFNPVTRVAAVLSITTGGNVARTCGVAVSLSEGRTPRAGVVKCDQPRALDLAARHSTRLERRPDEITADVLAPLVTVLS